MNSEGFKRKTYLEILADMQNVARELYGESVNLTERSPLGMWLQATAWEISQSWEEIEESHYNSFSMYANGLNLDDAVSNFGRVRFNGTKATTQIQITGDIGTIVPLGFLCSTNDGIIFKTKQEVTLITTTILVDVESLEIGVDKNVPMGSITKIVNPISGVKSITNPQDATGASDIESDDMLRLRNLEILREPATGDNAIQYKLWAREIKGVGGIKIQPTTPTKGYTTIIISGADGLPASPELVTEVYNHIDVIKPINAGIYVYSATTKNIDISSNITLAVGYVLLEVKEVLEGKIKEYFKQISLEETYISHAQIGKLILEVDGVIDYTNLTLNTTPGNIALGETEIATLNVLELI